MAAIANAGDANEALDGFETVRGPDAFEGSIEDAVIARRELESSSEHEPPEATETGYECKESRTVGQMVMQTEDGGIRFAKPSGRSSNEMLGPIMAMEQGDAALTELTDYVWHTLAEWSVDEEYDYDYWADEHALLDTVELARNVALGGEAPNA